MFRVTVCLGKYSYWDSNSSAKCKQQIYLNQRDDAQPMNGEILKPQEMEEITELDIKRNAKHFSLYRVYWISQKFLSFIIDCLFRDGIPVKAH